MPAVARTRVPVAVVLDGGNLHEKEMQQITNWTNLSETTFVLGGRAVTCVEGSLRLA